MPTTRIELNHAWPDEIKQQMIDQVHDATVAAFKIPPGNKLIRIIEHAPGAFAIPDTAGEHYALIEVALFPGRSLDAKREFYRRIVESFAAFGFAPIDVHIMLNEIPRDNWGINGGIPASDIS